MAATTTFQRPPGRSLPLDWHWARHLKVAGGAALILITIMLVGRPVGWPSVVGLAVLLWALFAGYVWLRLRAQLVRDGRMLWVRRLRRWRGYDARAVTNVDEKTSWSGVCYRITLIDGSRHELPAALFNGGHSTVLGWVMDHAPEAVFDRGARRSSVYLHERGRLEHHSPRFDSDGRVLAAPANTDEERFDAEGTSSPDPVVSSRPPERTSRDQLDHRSPTTEQT